MEKLTLGMDFEEILRAYDEEEEEEEEEVAEDKASVPTRASSVKTDTFGKQSCVLFVIFNFILFVFEPLTGSHC